MAFSLAGVSLRRASVSGLFLAAGIGLGTWGACLPLIKRGLALSDGELGSALLCFAVGAMVVMPFIGRLAQHGHAGHLGAGGGVGFGLVLLALPHAPSLPLLAFGIFLMGVTFGVMDVSMNLLGTVVERIRRRPVMASFHAAYSIGLLGAAMMSGGLFALGLGARGTLLVAALLIIALAIGGTVWLRRLSAPEAERAPAQSWRALIRDPVALGMGALAFLGFFAEGAMSDWTAVYVVQQVGLGEEAGAAAFSLFAGAMALARMIGGQLDRALGPVRTLTLSAGLAILGFVAAAAFPVGPVVLPAFALVGFGIANIVPVIFSATGRRGGERAASIFPFVVGIGYAGIMIGPPVIGAVAEHFSLRGGLLVLVLGLAVIIVFRQQVAGER